MATNTTDLLSNQSVLNTYETHRIAAPELSIVDRVITPLWYIIGIIGNPLSTKIWLSKKMRRTNSSAIYLGSIAIVHTIFIILHVWTELLQAWGFTTYNRPSVCEVYMVLFMTPQYLAPLLILGFTFERFLAICYPFLMESVCTVKKATIAVIACTIFAFLLSCMQAFIWYYYPPMDVCYIRYEWYHFYNIWTWISEMLIFAAVPLTVLIFNICVIVEIKKINQFGNGFGQDRGSNQTSTLTLLSVSFYLICTLLPATIVYAMQTSIKEGKTTIPPEEWANDSSWTSYLTYYHIRRIIEEICFSNYCCYVFVYCITSSYFREELLKMFSGVNVFRFKKTESKPTANTAEYISVKGDKTEVSESFL